VVFGGRRGTGDVGPCGRQAGAPRAGGGLDRARLASDQGHAADDRGRQRPRARCVGLYRRWLVGVAPASAQARVARVPDLELDPAAGGGLERHGRVEQQAQQERQERATGSHALILARGRSGRPIRARVEV